MSEQRIGVWITLGKGAEAGIVEADHPDFPDELVLRIFLEYDREYEEVNFGTATEKRIQALIDNLERLKLHAVPEPEEQANG